MKVRMFSWAVVAALVLVVTPAVAEPHTYGFYSVTNNNPMDAAIGEAQLLVKVAESEDDRVSFKFRNEGPEASSIARIYFDDFGLFDSIYDINYESGVQFSQGANPGVLPGGNEADPAFQVTPGLLASADSPPPHNGVNPGEWVEILMNLSGDYGFDDVIAGIHSGALRIGLHVIAFASGGSESFIIVPTPAAALLGLLGLSMAGMKLRKRV